MIFDSSNKKVQLFSSKKAQLFQLAIVLMFMLGIGTAAFYISESYGNSMTGFVVYTDGCSGFIDTSGTYTLESDLSCSSDNGILINGSDITLDCNGHTISGNGAYGIKVVASTGNLDNIVIQECTVKDFDVALNISTEGGNTLSVNITKNSLDGDGSDIAFNESGNDITSNVWLNNFNGAGIGGFATNLDFCIYESTGTYADIVGNYYSGSLTPVTTGCPSGESYRASLPSSVVGGNLPLLCGVNITGSVTLTDDLHDWGSSSDTICSYSTTGFVLDSASASLDCDGYNIEGSDSGVGVQFASSADGAEVKDCVITNFSTGININESVDADVFENNINFVDYGIIIDSANTVQVSDNVLNATIRDLNVSGSSLTLTVWTNSFFGTGINDSTIGTYCIGNPEEGNFYASSITDNHKGNLDCGSSSFTSPDSGNQENVTSLDLIWNASDAAGTVKYYLEKYNDSTNVLLSTENPSSAFYQWDTSMIMNDTYRFRIIPETDGVNGSADVITLNIINDYDGDGFSSALDNHNDDYDCDGRNDSIHQPVNRENISNPEVSNFCYDAVDDDCDGAVDWFDSGCGNGFTIGSKDFSAELYLNGSITDLSTSAFIGGGYYVLVNNSYGKIEYTSSTNLSTVDLSSVFTISENSIAGDPDIYGSRFNKTATITFYNLSQYTKVPIILRNGIECPVEYCTNQNPPLQDGYTDFDINTSGTKALSFTSAGFSTYSTANNSQISIFTYDEPEASHILLNQPSQLETYHRLKFFANYSKYPSGTPINNRTDGYMDQNNNGACNIWITKPNGQLIKGIDSEVVNYDFEAGLSSWISSAYINSSAVFTTPVMGYVSELIMNDTGCSSDNITCFGFSSANIVENTSSKFYNVTFLIKSNISVSSILINLSDGVESHSDFISISDDWNSYYYDTTFTGSGGPLNVTFALVNNVSGNYTVYLDDVIIYTNRSSEMTYDNYYGVYYYESGINDFEDASDNYRYNISCQSDLYEPFNVSEQFSVIEDVTPPSRPVLYPQLLLHPTNFTDDQWTYVAGYFGESDIDYTTMILHGYWAYNFSGDSSSTILHSEFKGGDVVVNFNSIKGQNVTFTNWNKTLEEALQHFKYVEFSTHNRTYFKRYHIYRSNRTGDDIRIEFYENLEKDVIKDISSMSLFTAPYPAGYFIVNASLFAGTNRITVWGDDSAGNSGYASEDWINAPYLDTAPLKPYLWTIPEAIRSDNESMVVYGIINETLFDDLNMTINLKQDYSIYTTYNDSSFISAQLRAECPLAGTDDVPINNSFFYVDPFYYNAQLSSINFSDLSVKPVWVEFDNHNRSYWERYNVTNVTKYPGEDYRIYVSPDLEMGVNSSVVSGFYNATYPHGWFNISVNVSDLVNSINTNGSHSLYAVAFRTSSYPPIEGPSSDLHDTYIDPEVPMIDLTDTPSHSNSRTPVLNFNISDNYKINILTLRLNISNSSWNQVYDYKNISCVDTYNNQSVYDCGVTLQSIENGTYTINVSVSDIAGWTSYEVQPFTVQITTVDVLSVFDEDDITNDPWLYFNWTTTGGDLSNFEYTIGSSIYNNTGWNEFRDWTSMCDVVYNILDKDSVTKELIQSFNGAKHIDLADMNGDSYTDIIVGGTDGLVWWENNRTGSFLTSHIISATSVQSNAIVAFDFDNNGNMDLVNANSSGLYLLNNTGSSFVAITLNDTVGSWSDVEVVNFTNDEFFDVIAVSSSVGGGIAWFDNSGSSSFNHNSISAVSGWDFVEAVDIDSNGLVDILASSGSAQNISWWNNTGSVGNSVFSDSYVISKGVDWRDVQSADLDNDGDMDIVGVGNSNLSWWENDGSESFVTHIINESVYWYGAEIVDVDNDADLDLVITGYTSGLISWYENNDGTFDSLVYHQLQSGFGGAMDLELFDLDDDGFNDIVSVANTSDEIALFEFELNSTYNCTANYLNLTNEKNISKVTNSTIKMMTGTVYYATIRAKDMAGDYGEIASSNGILFIDNTPPVFGYISDGGPWSDDNTSITSSWSFTDPESDIVEYQYAIGNTSYPNIGWDSIKTPTLIGTTSSIVYPTSGLEENKTYYVNVKARNNNVAMSYAGSWSSWYTSPGVTIDTMSPIGGSISWTNQSYITSGFVTVNYDVGYDYPYRGAGTSNNVKGLIEVGTSLIVNNECQPIVDFDWNNDSDVLDLTGSSYRDISVNSGHCYVFRLFTWDSATNSRTYQMSNETVMRVLVDRTPPGDVAPVIDDGFYTNDWSNLHADWSDSSDGESGFENYYWSIVDQSIPTPTCVVNTTEPIGTNCSSIASGVDTNSEVSISNLSLIHNHKYYFEVFAKNKAGLNSDKRYSDGIIYIDNAAPESVHVYSVNDDTDRSNGFLSERNDGIINITAYGDTDGHIDTDECVLMVQDIDYSGDTSSSIVLSSCEVDNSVSSNLENVDVWLTDSKDRTISKISCVNETNYSGGNPTQENFVWYISCKDFYGNTQTYDLNTEVNFTVNWPEPPFIPENEHVIGDENYASPVYSNMDVHCLAQIYDEEENLNTSSVQILWWVDGENVLNNSVSLYTFSTGQYTTYYTDNPAIDNDNNVLPYAYTRRGQNVTCEVFAEDTRGQVNRSNASIIISNYQPSTVVPNHLFMNEPVDISVNKNMTFSWTGPAADTVDFDVFTYRIVVDDEGTAENPIFNYSNNANLSFVSTVTMSVGGMPLTSTQRNADIYRNKVVYEDNRAGNWDIYLYDFDSDTEIPVVINSLTQSNPHIYGNVVVYEEGSSIFKFNINNFTKQEFVSGIASNHLDMFGKYVVYHNTTGIVYLGLEDASLTYIPAPTTIRNLSVYGRHIVWVDENDDVVVYDVINDQNITYSGTYDNALLFGSLLVLEEQSGNVINITDINEDMNYSAVLVGNDISLYGNLLTYTNVTGGITVTSVQEDGILFNVSLGAGSNPVIYDDLVVWENSNSLDYSTRVISLPTTMVFESFIDSNNYLMSTLSTNDSTYAWMIEACDSSFQTGSCVWGTNTSLATPSQNFALFTVDNTAPTISGISPTDSSVVTNVLRMRAEIIDNQNDYVQDANFSLDYLSGVLLNGSVYDGADPIVGDLSQSGTLWMGDEIDFSIFDYANFSLTITARDYLNNTASEQIYFAADNDTPWFVFGTGLDEITIDGLKTFNDSIESDFSAHTVLTSTLRIYGPLPSTTVRFTETMVNSSVTDHHYVDDIYTLTWPDGKYVVEFSGTNYDYNDGSIQDSRIFYVDHNQPVAYNNHSNPSPLYASEDLTMWINWSDITLSYINASCDNTNISASERWTAEEYVSFNSANYIGSKNVSYSIGKVQSFINQTYECIFTAKDAINRTDVSITSVFVESTPPSFVGIINNITLVEDLFNDNQINIDNYFNDLDSDDSTWGYLDNITFSYWVSNANVSVTLDSMTGLVTNITSTNNFTGDVILIFNATDYYGKTTASNNITVFVTPVNDIPYFNNTINNMISLEDNSTGLVFNLSNYAMDVEGDTIYWDEISYNSSVLDLTYDSGFGDFNFTLVQDMWDIFNLTLGIRDSTSGYRYVNITINISDVADTPTAPVVTNITSGAMAGSATPNISSTNNMIIPISWNASYDGDSWHGDTVNYTIEYHNSSGSYVIATDVVGTSYDWNSTLNISGVTQDINISVTAFDNDGLNTESSQYGEFTVDNSYPLITFNWPLLITVGPWFLADVTTNELATCIFSSPNSSVLFDSSTSVSTYGTSHIVNVSSYSTYNLTYAIDLICTDNIGNPNSVTKYFEPHLTALEFMTASANPSIAYLGQSINITIEVAANDTLSTGLFDIVLPDASTVQFDLANTINASTKFTYITYGTTQIGIHNFTVNTIDTPSVSSQNNIEFGPLFRVYPAVNHTLNILN